MIKVNNDKSQNSTGLHIKESSQQTFEILSNNVDVRFLRAYQKCDCQTIKYYRPNISKHTSENKFHVRVHEFRR